MSTETLARLRVFSDHLLPEEITERIGVQPESTVTKGAFHGGKTIRAKRSEWQLGSGVSRTESLERHVSALLQKLEPAAARIRLLSESGCEVTFSCVVYASVAPAIFFEPTWISGIAQLGAALDVDLYMPNDGV